jgi:hypothetical protein
MPTAAYIGAGKTPGSIGAADAWTLTDWFENILVRTAGPDVYQELFVTHEIAWTDAKVVAAMKALQAILDPAESNLAGGVDSTLSTDFISAANFVLRPDNPGAEMYYEGGFMGGIIANNFPDLVAVRTSKSSCSRSSTTLTARRWSAAGISSRRSQTGRRWRRS